MATEEQEQTIVISSKQALAILNECKAVGVFTDEIPRDLSERKALAQKLYVSAKKSQSSGIKKKIISMVISIAEQDPVDFEPTLRTAKKKPAEVERMPEIKTMIVKLPNKRVKKTEIVRPISSAIEQATAARRSVMKRIGDLTVPPELTSRDVPPLDRDLTNKNEKAIRKLFGDWEGVHGHVTWMLSLVEIDLIHSEHIADSKKRAAYFTVTKVEEGVKKTVVAIEHEIENNDEVVDWVKKIADHKKDRSALRALQAIAKGNVERISRELTVRIEANRL